MDGINYSVLMSVYDKEKAEFLKQSVDSMFNQTIQTNDFVLVCDGPLNETLETVIKEIKLKYNDIFRIIRLEQNKGLGNALAKGLVECKNELVVRMDSDDISYPNRVEKQLNAFREFPDIAVCGGIVEEFFDDPEEVDTQRVLPELHSNISKYSQYRNPFNHPSVMFKKSCVFDVGNYQDFYLLEDYYLWIRMIMRGYKGYNLQEPILKMRTGSSQYRRRGGIKYAQSQVRLFWWMKKNSYIGFGVFIWSVFSRTISSLLPNNIREFIYRKVLRKIRKRKCDDIVM